MTQPERPILDYRTPKDEVQRTATRPVLLWTVGVIAGFVLLTMFMLPQLGPHPERANRIKCLSNLRQIGHSIALYRQDYQVWPQTLAQILIGGDLNPEMFTCPSSSAERAPGTTPQEAARSLTNPKHCSYIYFPPPADAGDMDAETVLAMERMENHESQGMNILFGDGHTEWFDAKSAQFILSELKAGHNPPRRPATQPATALGGQ